MDIDSLVKRITSEVIKKLEVKNKDVKRKILFLARESERVKVKYDLFIPNWSEVEFLDEEIVKVKNYDFIICPELSNKELTSIANGMENTENSSYIIEAILYGKKVICIDEGIQYKRFKNTCNNNFYRMLCDYEEKIKSFGIEIAKCSDLKKVLAFNKKDGIKTDIANLEEKSYTNELINKKVITQSDIEKIYSIGRKDISIQENALITPLAKDYIRTKGINIKRL